MQIVADLQLHSKYSRAVSPKMDLYEIARWSQRKGINLVATGDWTHPLWFKQIQTTLKESASGIYSIAGKNYGGVKFLLSTEISSIYTQSGKQRRVHNLIFSPSIETCAKIIKELERKRCNLMSDGRPIIGLSSKELLEVVLTIDKNVLFIPAHAWTPWFSIFGSKSGFDSIEECFGNLAKNIYAIETGLSSDPIMNWQVENLNNCSILSFSDAHSGPKLGREATVFVPNTISNFKFQISNFTYEDIASAIKQDPKSSLKIGYTIEFFPEEGKYHWSGHRNCNVKLNPREVKEKGIICPVCRQPLTIGVENRVLDLSKKILSKGDLIMAQNKVGLTFVYDKEKKRKPFVSLVPLLEILLEMNAGSKTKAELQYENLIANFATEFDILLRKPYEEIEKNGGKNLRDAIETVRSRKVYVDPGYDGVFGVVKIFDEKNHAVEKKPEAAQPALF